MRKFSIFAPTKPWKIGYFLCSPLSLLCHYRLFYAISGFYPSPGRRQTPHSVLLSPREHRLSSPKSSLTTFCYKSSVKGSIWIFADWQAMRWGRCFFTFWWACHFLRFSLSLFLAFHSASLMRKGIHGTIMLSDQCTPFFFLTLIILWTEGGWRAKSKYEFLYTFK